MVNQNFRPKISKAFLIISLMIPATGCMAGVSHFERSVSVSNTFEHYGILPDYQYYYNGLPSSPDAVVAVRKGYKLTSPYWHPTEITEQKLKHWMMEMLSTAGSEYNMDPNGANILNDKGERIGVWYSVWDTPLLKFITDTEFSISNPMTIFPPGHADPEAGISSSFFGN